MTVLAITVAVTAIFAKWFLDSPLRPWSFLTLLALISGALSIAAVATAWLIILRILRIEKIQHLCLDEKAIADFSSGEIDEVYWGYIGAIKEMVVANGKNLHWKASQLKWAKRSVSMAGLFVLIFVVTVLMRGYVERHGDSDKMAKQQQNTPQNSGSGGGSDGKPAATTPPAPTQGQQTGTNGGVNPTIQLVTEGTDPARAGIVKKTGDEKG